MQDIRYLAYSSLLSCIENQKFSNLEAASTIEKNQLTERDRSFYTALFYGVTEKQITLDHQIKKLSRIPIEKLQTKALVLLRLGLYQILFMDGVQDHAAVNETVAIAKKQLNAGAVGYINGLLRSAQRELKDENGKIRLLTPDRSRDICGYLSITYSYPRYLCKLWVQAYGEETAEAIMSAQNNRTETTLRVNTLVTSAEDYLKLLTDSGYKAKRSEVCKDGINIEGSAGISSLPRFNDGAFFVQDDSSRMCVMALDPQEGERILDACACPGGKSFASAIAMNNKGSITSCDLHESKLSLISDGAKRLGISIITAKQADSSVLNTGWSGAFDRVLCDVPCSGFGTISKKPDLRLKTAESVKDLPAIQLAIVSNCAKYVRDGGILVYSTCTLNPAENEDNVNAFLSQNPDFTLDSMKTHFPSDGVNDGFFYAKMHKK